MTDQRASKDLISIVNYGPDGELLSMTGSSVVEVRTHNSTGQLLTLTGLNGTRLLGFDTGCQGH